MANNAVHKSANRQQMANAIRALAMDAVDAANSGHPGMPMGMADVATTLFCEHLKFDPSQPNWPDRDRFILSAGHGSMLLYALLYLTGYEDITMTELRNFRQMGARTAGHPEYGHAAGIETTTGPLGQGFANGVGMAMAERHLAARFGDALVDHHTFVIAGDGCLMEGISHEAASMAGHMKLDRLIVLFDDNGISIDGSVDLTVSDDISARFEAYGWQVLSCDGHDMPAISAAITAAKGARDKPTLLRCKTDIGKGSPNRAGTAKAHGAPLGADENALTRAALDWPHPAFEIPDDILAQWRSTGTRGQSVQADWQKRLNASAHSQDFTAALAGDYDAALEEAIGAYKATLHPPQKLATRVASQNAIEAILPAVPELFGGSADLTGSNNTRTGAHEVFASDNYAGNYIHYGVREHGMAGAMNGIALHGGAVPYGGTFLVFSDYCRPSIRLSALMGQRMVYVMTHDSIGLGEDGPTHQPVEHLASLRAIPNLNVFRPADVVETAEAWQIALCSRNTPSVLALSRQGLPQMRLDDIAENRSARGGYILREASAVPQIVLMASGSEVAIAEDARTRLEADGIATRLVSVPCLDILLAQPASYLAELRGAAKCTIAVEAGIEMGWSKLLGANGQFVGMQSFGASAPIADLYQHFGITAEAIIAAAKSSL